MSKVLFSILYACFIIVAFGTNAVCQDTNSSLGKWQYRYGNFTDVHEFLPGGKMGNDPRGTWEIRGNQLIVRWPNGWANIYTWVPGASQLSGVNEDPKGQTQKITLTRITAPPSPTPPIATEARKEVIGQWQYRYGNFTDVHEFLPGGKMGNDPRGTWEIRGNQLIVRWPNGWANIYTWVPGASQLSGVNEDPKGQTQKITLTRLAAPPSPTPLKSLTGAWVHSADSSTQTPDNKVIVVQDGGQVTLTQAYKAEGTQGHWVTLICSGPLSNGEVRLRCNWAPGGNPLGFSGNALMIMRMSADGNHMDGTLQTATGTQESHYSRIR